MTEKLRIYDLDGTMICSKHRAITKADGSLDLDKWIENCTKEKIFGDSLLPLAGLCKSQIEAPDTTVIACTARVMSIWDYAFLRNHGIKFDAIISRPVGCMTSDHIMKLEFLKMFLWKIPGRDVIMYDDNDAVRDTLSAHLGITCLHPEQVA